MTKEDLSTVIGRNIRSERTARNMSIEQLAEILGLSPSAVGLMERGGRGTTALSMLKISEIFDLPVDHFFQEKNSPSLAKIGKQGEAQALMSGFSDEELGFVITMVKELRKIRNLQ